MADQIYNSQRHKRKQGGNVEHTRLIAELCTRDPQIQAVGFWRSVNALTEELDFMDPVRKQPFLPDAFKINRGTQELEIHEVVRTHDVSPRKLLAMGCLWGEFDNEQEEWHPVLFIHREGFIPRRIELFASYLDVIKASAARRVA